jgi:hypothetical protein
MSRTLNQQMADAHEADIAEWIGGAQHKGSGNQWSRQMDASNGEKLVPFPLAGDGKATLGKSISITRDMWLKAVAQTFNKIPTIWLRFYRDESLREVSTDLVVIERREFLEILEKARLCEEILQQHHLVVPPSQTLADTIQQKQVELEAVLSNAPQRSELLPTQVCEAQGTHDYISTACHHAKLGQGAEYLHARCRDTCKFCGAPCKCRCHDEHQSGCDCCR